MRLSYFKKNSIKKHRCRQQGFIALITVLLVLTITLTVGLTLTFLSISEAKMGLQKNQSSQAYYLANLCAEHALMRLKETNGSYTGQFFDDIENGSCQISIEGNWTVKVLANFQNQVKKMKIIVSQINPEMIIESWEEVAEF